jgi:hypothetical protein
MLDAFKDELKLSLQKSGKISKGLWRNAARDCRKMHLLLDQATKDPTWPKSHRATKIFQNIAIPLGDVGLVKRMIGLGTALCINTASKKSNRVSKCNALNGLVECARPNKKIWHALTEHPEFKSALNKTLTDSFQEATPLAMLCTNLLNYKDESKQYASCDLEDPQARVITNFFDDNPVPDPEFYDDSEYPYNTAFAIPYWTALAKFFLEQGANPTSPKSHVDTAVYWASCMQTTDLNELLWPFVTWPKSWSLACDGAWSEESPVWPFPTSPFSAAISHQSLANINFLHEKVGLPQDVLFCLAANQRNPLTQADLRVFSLLLELRPDALDFEHPHFGSVLLCALRNVHLELCEALLAAGAVPAESETKSLFSSDGKVERKVLLECMNRLLRRSVRAHLGGHLGRIVVDLLDLGDACWNYGNMSEHFDARPHKRKLEATLGE